MFDHVKQFKGDKIFQHLDRLAQWQRGEKPVPVTVEIDSTNLCNLKCYYCSFGEYIKNDRVSLNREDMLRVIGEMAGLGVRGLTFTGGGEPLVNPHTLEAVEFAKKNPRGAFLEEVTSSKGRFHFVAGKNNDLYIFVYDLEGRVLAHGVRRELVGITRWNAKDPDGKFWIQDWTRLVKEKGSGWIEYKELNPAQGNKVMKKASWVELTNGMVIGAGVYE